MAEQLTGAKPDTSPLRAVKGMNDILPPDSWRWEWLEGRLRTLMARYGYQNARTPIVEPTALFVRGLGEVTDIVEKEMYSFVDSMNGDHLSSSVRIISVALAGPEPFTGSTPSLTSASKNERSDMTFAIDALRWSTTLRGVPAGARTML